MELHTIGIDLGKAASIWLAQPAWRACDKAADHTFLFAENTGVEPSDQHCTVRRIHSFGWQGGSATMVNMKSRTGSKLGQYRCGAGQPWSLTPRARPTTSVGC